MTLRGTKPLTPLPEGHGQANVLAQLATFIPEPNHQSHNALTAQLVLIRASGQPDLRLQDLRKDWQASRYLHIRVDGLYLNGTLSLSAALNQQGILTENCPVRAMNYIDIDHRHPSAALLWLTKKVSEGCGVLVNLEVNDVPALKQIYNMLAQQPDHGHTVIVVGIQRDNLGRVLALDVLDPALKPPTQRLPVDDFMVAWLYRGFAAAATVSPLPQSPRRSSPNFA